MEVVDPSMMVSRLDLVVLDTAEVGTTHQGAPGPPNAPWWFVPPAALPRVQLGPNFFLLVHKKSS